MVRVKTFKPQIIPNSISVCITSCGENLCLCDDTARSASCQPEQGRPAFSFFPKLPRYIMQVTFKDFIRPAITRDLSLKFLRLEHMIITYMEEGLFRSFPKLRVLNISNNGYLTTSISKYFSKIRKSCSQF